MTDDTRNVDVNDVNFPFLLKVDKVERLEWLMEELEIQFNALIDKYAVKTEKNYLKLAARLVDYFKDASADPDSKVRQFATLGLKQIESKFPWLMRGGQRNA